MDPFVIADRSFTSRLIVGTGKYPSNALMAQAHHASGAELVTVAVRRVNLGDRTRESMLDYIDIERYQLLPNTAGCYTAEEAIRTARLAREAGMSNWVKLEVIGDERTLFPDNEALLVATHQLVKEGFVVLPYTTDDPVVCRKLEDAGAAATADTPVAWLRLEPHPETFFPGELRVRIWDGTGDQEHLVANSGVHGGALTARKSPTSSL